MNRRIAGWTLLVVVNVLVISVLSLDRPTAAAPPSARPPFSNSVEQRGDMIKELREIKALLREQNGILRGLSNEEKSNVQMPRR